MESKNRRRILLKLTGTIFNDQKTNALTMAYITTLIKQIDQLRNTYHFSIVIGGGNFFRGNQQGKLLGLTADIGHQIGMLATMMNGLIIKDCCDQHIVPSTLLSAVPCPLIGNNISSQTITQALAHNELIIFTGGTGNPFFTTDTNAILRGLQIKADEVWKGTNVDGIYTADPKTDQAAQIIKSISHKEALRLNLAILDSTAYALAEEYHMPVRVFNIFTPHALITATQDKNFGSILH
jgi:uridylate kinase